MMTLTIPLSFSITTNQFDNPRQLQWNLWMDRHKEPYTTCSVCTFVPTLTLDQISVIVQVYNLFALPAMPISWSGRWGETRRDTKTLVGLPEQTQIMQNVVHPLQTVHGQWRCDVGLTRIFSEMSDDFANLCKCIARYFCQPVKYFYRYVRSGLCRPVKGAQGERGQGGSESGWGGSWLGKLHRAAETEKNKHLLVPILAGSSNFRRFTLFEGTFSC